MASFVDAYNHENARGVGDVGLMLGNKARLAACAGEYQSGAGLTRKGIQCRISWWGAVSMAEAD
jgi:hypothetical protein